ncbi:uncharacterized protein LOC124443418 [Xenia sp. Carnegie-2017]|uniref:uncharacterized protein LOC124443418 n=1 Tax=Xenia sp. Carnegie-2017 TaxID=2897299 RepID=UPI001F033827|nr:uncharacterized protein LOC124443418 [Xenia sp. Carnegie-2017]
MESDQSGKNLWVAKQKFVSLLSTLSTGDDKDFLDWVIEQYSMLLTGDGSYAYGNKSMAPFYQEYLNGEQKLLSIKEDLCSQLPFDGSCSSETVYQPEVGKNSDCDPTTTVVIDSFLYDEDDIEMLCDQNLFNRNYCKKCGSHNTAPLTLISHSMSVLQMKYIFKNALPKLGYIPDATILDVGSRLGAVLYGAYFFSHCKRIVGVEMNKELCLLQNQIIHKYSLGDRIEVFCNDICNAGMLLQEADIIILNNTFEFFLKRDAQISTWKNIRRNLSKSGSILITIPSLEESLCIGDGGKEIMDIHSWLVPLIVNANDLSLNYSEDDLQELNMIHFYKVK